MTTLLNRRRATTPRGVLVVALLVAALLVAVGFVVARIAMPPAAPADDQPATPANEALHQHT